ncbi:MAG: SDR family oxidoreductase [Marinilabiliaceae bacterium]|nr:SDR family oxidoreductase [Marinilabiliaceae bacterium]
MRVLLTGATGYIGKHLLPLLLAQGHDVVCCVRDKNRFHPSLEYSQQIQIVEIDFLKTFYCTTVLPPFDVAFYLIHTMTSGNPHFNQLEQKAAIHFRELVNRLKVKQVVYLSGIVNHQKLSKHLKSRLQVESVLRGGNYALTVLRAGIIVGSGSASFEIIRDLVEKLPVMITPKWLLTPCQPISIINVEQFLIQVMGRSDCMNQTIDIGGPEVLTYKEMLLQYASVRKLKRWIMTIPVMTPRLSSYWLFFITSTPYSLAVNLVDSMKVPIICRQNDLADRLGIKLIYYREAVQRALYPMADNGVCVSCKEALASSEKIVPTQKQSIYVPYFGCVQDVKQIVLKPGTRDAVIQRIWSIGGVKGWYFGNWLWRTRGWIDRLFGGVGLRRGRTHPHVINAGDALDFWRVLLADESEGRLLLYAEMKLPGEAWLEFKIVKSELQEELVQTATFRPKGLAGRAYWILSWPFHFFIFRGMARQIALGKK